MTADQIRDIVPIIRRGQDIIARMDIVGGVINVLKRGGRIDVDVGDSSVDLVSVTDKGVRELLIAQFEAEMLVLREELAGLKVDGGEKAT